MRRLLSVAVLAVIALALAPPARAQMQQCTLSASAAVLHYAGETAYTLSPNDQCHLLVFQNTGADAVSIPPPGSYFPGGWTVSLIATGAGTVTLSTPLGGNINGASSVAVNTSQGGTLYNDGTNWWFLSGTGASQGTLSFGAGSTIGGSLAGGATAAAITSTGANGNLLLQSVAGVGTGSVAIGGSTLASSALQIPNVTSSVDFFKLTSSATGNPATISLVSGGTDSNVNVLLGSSGTGVLAFGGATVAAASEQIATVTSSVDFLKVSGAATANPAFPALAATGTDTNVGMSIQTKGTGPVYIGNSANTAAGFQVATVASAINQFVATPAATAGIPTLLAGGASADATEPGTFGTLGTGNINFATGGATNYQVKITNTVSAVDFFSLTGAATASPATITLSAAGSDSNINIAVTPKGTGSLLPTGGIGPAGAFASSCRLIATGGAPANVAASAYTAQTPVTTEVYIAEVFVPANCTATGVAVYNSGTISGNMKVGLANSSGANVATSASTAMSGTTTYQLVPFTGTYAVVGPATYYVETFYDNNTVRPNTYTSGAFGAAKQTGQTYATGFTSITPPTTFTTALAPVASLY